MDPLGTHWRRELDPLEGRAGPTGGESESDRSGLLNGRRQIEPNVFRCSLLWWVYEYLYKVATEQAIISL